MRSGTMQWGGRKFGKPGSALDKYYSSASGESLPVTGRSSEPISRMSQSTELPWLSRSAPVSPCNQQLSPQMMLPMSQSASSLPDHSVSMVPYVCQWVPVATPVLASSSSTPQFFPLDTSRAQAIDPWLAQSVQPMWPSGSGGWMCMMPYSQYDDLGQYGHVASSEEQCDYTSSSRPKSTLLEQLQPLERVFRRRGLGSGIRTPSSIGSPLPSSRCGTECPMSHHPTPRAKASPEFEGVTVHISNSSDSPMSSSRSSTATPTHGIDATTCTSSASDGTTTPPVEAGLQEERGHLRQAVTGC